MTFPNGLDPTLTVRRLASFAPRSYDAEAHSVRAVLSSGAGVKRWFGVETLRVAPEAVDLARVGLNQVKLLDSHDAYDLSAVLGTVTDVRIENDNLTGTLNFADTEQGRAAEARVASGELTGISIGYRIDAMERIALDGETETWAVTRWELLEVSLVSVPADPRAGVRSGTHGHQPAQRSVSMEPIDTATGETPATTPAAPVQDTAAAIRAERARVADLNSRFSAARGVIRDLDETILSRAIADGTTPEALTNVLFQRMIDRTDASPTRAPAERVEIIRDETETRRVGMTEAIALRIAAANGGPRPVSNGPAAEYVGRTLVDMAAVCIGHRGAVPFDFGGREEILRRAFHTTSDFPNILTDAINRRMVASYELARPTYRQIARRSDFTDFRTHHFIAAGNFPLPVAVGEGGEIKYGTFGDKKETLAVGAYAVGLNISRQALVNDNMGQIATVLQSSGQSVALFEEKTFFTTFLTGANSDGQTLVETARQVYNTTDLTKAGTAAAITVASIAIGRASMMKQKGVTPGAAGTAAELIANVPSILLCGPDKLTEAETIVAPLAPAQASNVNPFSGKLTPLATAQLTGNVWYLFPEPSMGSNYIWGYLDGYTAPRLSVEQVWDVQGVKAKLEHDFGCGAVDYRFGYKNAGA